MSRFAGARAIADTVLYEGYLLYPYTASARKNQQRWQFGVVVPRAYAAGGTGDCATMQTEVLVDGADSKCAVDIVVRFLQVQTRDVQVLHDDAFQTVESAEIGGSRHITWEEAIEREIPCRFEISSESLDMPIEFPASRLEEPLHEGGVLAGRLVRETMPLRGHIRVEAFAQGEDLRRLRVRIENDSELEGEGRTAALRTAFLSCHTLLAIDDSGLFVSLMDVPEKLKAAAKTCVNEQTWPVLVGDATRDSRYGPMMLSSPIILYDYPINAPQSEGDKFDGTEVDELLNLSILTMSDAEKAEARATDPRAKTLIDRAQAMSSEQFAQLHGAGQVNEGPAFGAEEPPGTTHLVVNGVRVEKGSHVRLHPSRRADVWDTFLKGKTAHVKGVYEDFERQRYVAVSIDDDPASDMHDWYGRSLFFYPDEIEPLEALT